MSWNIRASSIVLMQMLAGSALADSTYKAADIVALFAAPEITRGICVGSAEECPSHDEKRPSPIFDMQINFGKNSAALSPDAENNLMQFSIALRSPRLAALRFAIDGFTDASGSDRHNLALSARRAQSVVAFLTELGVEPSRLKATGFGETNPREPDPYDPRNRRVEAHIAAE